ncbi:protein takeout-like isoform X1 [Periplaneta americana]|uniref:protein takeout-like isoform X1 n=1 Tax=Periplaneta americana TaxID=6978 RepID=UPI0037E9845A
MHSVPRSVRWKKARKVQQKTNKMKRINFTILITILLSVDASGGKETKKNANDYFKLCSRSDPELGNCIKNSIEDFRPKLIKGVPELGLVPLDPLHIPRIEFKDGTGNFRLKQVLTNLTIYGLRDFNLQRVVANMDNLTMDIYMQTPTMTFTADYDLEGRVLLLPISGKGDCILNFTDVTANCHIVNKFVTRDGKKFIEMENLKWDIDVKDCHSQFNNLFNGDKLLGETTNRFLNENWREAFETYRYLPEEAFGVLFKNLTNNVVRQFTYDELYLQ